MDYSMQNLLVRPWAEPLNPYLITRITPDLAGWQYLTMEARRLPADEVWEAYTGEHEMAIVILGGTCSIETNRGDFAEVGKRKDVFGGLPHALYLPRRTDFRLRATTDICEIAAAWVPTGEDHPIQLITPAEIKPELRGGGSATRQIHAIIPPGFDCQRLVVSETYSPGGNWSSYPPHKHDTHTVAPDGRLLEAALEEIYYYKIDKPEGYALQQVYTADRRIDAILRARTDDVVLVPEGYHPVVSAHGYTTYYLNFLAGSAQSLANSDDPAFAWLRSTWREKDARLPLFMYAPEMPAFENES